MTREVDGKNEILENYQDQDPCHEILQDPFLQVEIGQTSQRRLQIATVVDHFGVAAALHLAVHGLGSELMQIGPTSLDCASDVKLLADVENELDQWD